MEKITTDDTTRLFLTPEEAKTICRLGQGSNCCPFLTVSEDFVYVRMDYPFNVYIHQRIREGTMKAKGGPCDWDRMAAIAIERK
jgi:hypothetical protein